MRKLFIFFSVFLVYASNMALSASPIKYAGDDAVKRVAGGKYLIISSYSPETKRVGEFISQFEKEIINHDPECEILIEDLSCKSFNLESYLWSARIKAIIDKYYGEKLNAIILLGQEAWASFLQAGHTIPDVPFFAVYVSSNGIALPSGKNEYLSGWNTETLDMVGYSRKLGISGGDIVEYDISRNIELILKIYPDTKNIAFISDNTYGGISLQAYTKKIIGKYVDLTFIPLDARIMSFNKIKELASELPDNTVFLIGTWSINSEGLSMVKSTLRLVTGANPKLPVFTLTGTGLGIVSVGGYIPKYGGDASVVVNQIKNYQSGKKDSVKFVIRHGEFRFDKKRLADLGIEEYRLPEGSIIEDTEDPRVSQYRSFLSVLLVISSAMVLLLVILALLYRRNRRLMTSLAKREKELVSAKERAEESDRLKSSFLANMSHEIRTPLNAIVGFSDLLAKGDFTPEERVRYNELIFKNSENLISLINDILDISRLESDSMKFVIEDTEINSLCNTIVSTLLHQNKKNLNLVFSPGKDTLVMKTDPQRLSQVIINLMTNAIKFTDTGSVTLSYEVDEINKKVIFSVTDTGPGVSPANQKILFTRFVKLNEYKQGTGLGLAICKQIVTKLGGEIGIDPSYTSGARFNFIIPIK
jgi:signal transduction histidine kinase